MAFSPFLSNPVGRQPAYGKQEVFQYHDPAETSALAQGRSAELVAGINRDIAAGQQAGENRRADLAAQTARFPEEQKSQRFNTLLSMLTGQGVPGGGGMGGSSGMNRIGIPGVGGGGAGGGGGGFGGGFLGQFGGAQTPGGTVDPGRPFPMQNPWTPTRVAGDINAMKAQSARGLDSQLRGARQAFSARGFGALSPQYTAVANQAQSANLANTMNQERAIRNTANEANANQQFRYAQLGEQRRQAIGEEDVKRRTPFFPGAQSQLLSSLISAAL